MADALISGILNEFGAIIARGAEQEIRLVFGVDEEVGKLEGNLRTVKAVLSDAEKRQATDGAVKLWLKKLEHVCHEMDDVLDEWNTKMIKLKIGIDEEENAHVVKKKVCSFIPSPSCCFRQVDKIFLHRGIAHKIKGLSEKIDEIVRERERFGFELTTRGNASEVVERPKTTPFVVVSDICGRDNVRDDLVNILLEKGSEEEINPRVISLVGMGGIGKTTLAQLAYNHPEVETHFEKRMWVCVSDPFDQCSVAKEIIDHFRSDHPNTTELRSLLEEIHKLIGGKKFFLVLDDVWTEDYALWVPFRCVLNYGAQGSRILVTTCKSRVAEMMGGTSACMINLEVLSEKDCWLMFRRIAFSNRDFRQCEQLEDLGRQIAKKCKGYPLAAMTLGNLMRFKRSREQWKKVLDSDLWELEDLERDLFAPLLLSYNDLPTPLKQCFSFCAIFLKDYKIHIDDLVYMWMAQGYIDLGDNMEMRARDYFDILAVRSFFQDFTRDKYGNIKACKMHDIVHDFAQLLTKDVCFTVNSDTGKRSDYRNALHLHLKILEEAKIPESIFNARKLRTLILDVSGAYNVAKLFQHFRFLRTLTLNFQHAESRELLDGVENFIHLRYLNLLNYDVDKLPETIYNLYNLQILKISGCSSMFMKLPQGVDKIINLRHLIFGDFSFDNWVEFPRGIGRLSSLRTLSHFFVSGKNDGEGCKLGELKNLNHLHGTLEINGLGSVEDVSEVKNAQLNMKIFLRSLGLFFNVRNDERMENDVLVLNALEPPQNLEDLSIKWYKGTTMSPNWMMSLTKLKMLELWDCIDLECLPSLGKLPFLESLSIHNAESLKMVGVEYLGIESVDTEGEIFPKLLFLEFHNLLEWEEWIGIGEMREGREEEEDYIKIMPRLQKLKFVNCPKLNSLPDFLCTIPLKKLCISCCSKLYERCQRWEEWHKIYHIPNIKIDGEYVERDSQEVKSKASSSTMNLRD